MLANIAKKMFGSRNDRLLKQYQKVVKKINDMEPEIQALSDEQLQEKSLKLKEKVQAGASLDEVLVEAFAVCRESSVRVLNMRHFDVQLIGGMVLHDGKIAEMRTGEGKTLVATLAVYLNALKGQGVHVITVNDYLAARDAHNMGKLYNFLGMTVGVNLSQMQHFEKQSAYVCDITYGTNNEFGFDYLRDNMVPRIEDKVQRDLYFSVVDEVDSILIDEARTPLIISGQADDNVEMYAVMNSIPVLLSRQETEEGEGDYWVDEKAHQVVLSDEGHEHVEQILAEKQYLPEGESLYSANNIRLMHHLMAALRAHSLFHRDQHYVVQDDEIVIVDEFTGRLMSGRRWSDGLHQAVEAKEGVEIKKENQTLASITFQNYFRLYEKLSGMTGTADTEAYEFQNIYGLETVIIPTNRVMVRKDFNDQVYRSTEEKFEAVVADIKVKHEAGQPVLVGTTSIENSEIVSDLLNKEKLTHNVLNAKEHEREAYIITQAGRPGRITVATNMAGRGTDIVLGGNIETALKDIAKDENLTEEQKAEKTQALKDSWLEEHDKVIEAGGLHIVGTERHESRRIDNQLRGRSGRQGDPGSSRFYLSFEDPLLRLFAMDRAAAILNRLAPERGMAIEHGILTRQIEGAQRKVEGRNFDMRKQLLEYDDVANDQRKVIYYLRNEILAGEGVAEKAVEIQQEVISAILNQFIPNDTMEEEWDLSGLHSTLAGEFGLAEINVEEWLKQDKTLDTYAIKERILNYIKQKYEEKVEIVGPGYMVQFEQGVMLQTMDQQWREHLAVMDHLRQGIHLRGYGQKNPKQEYKRESFGLFQELLTRINRNIAQILITVQIEVQPTEAEEQNNQIENEFSEESLKARGILVRRNDPCPCGSGQRYKDCHGRLV